ncbi:type II toxin-antitoxin system Phd/YefM family antitoxin [Pseudonocardia sp. NPDC049635]|uniref:type II toxin-antitoxin system Phd/YefM family antitoxin n=1 Tax=Pseudonocardia sp. NPDC049635 TaxID=3155506 RepID=UPI0033DD384B
MSDQVNIYDAKTNLSRLIERVESGEEIVIARNGRPVARLVPAQRRRAARVPGALRGRIRMAGGINEGDDEIAELMLGEEAVADDQGIR